VERRRFYSKFGRKAIQVSDDRWRGSVSEDRVQVSAKPSPRAIKLHGYLKSRSVIRSRFSSPNSNVALYQNIQETGVLRADEVGAAIQTVLAKIVHYDEVSIIANISDS